MMDVYEDQNSIETARFWQRRLLPKTPDLLRPSGPDDPWQYALWNDDRLLLRELGASATPFEVLFEHERLLRRVDMAQMVPHARTDLPAEREIARRVATEAEGLRSRIGDQLLLSRFNTGALRWAAKAGLVGFVLGAGATCSVGGPSWPELVMRLLRWALEQGRVKAPAENAEPRKLETNYFTLRKYSSGQAEIEWEPLPADLAETARNLLARVEASPKLEDLTVSAQLCSDFFGNGLFQRVTRILAQTPNPGPLHQAMARLASVRFPTGRTCFVNYNFDSLLSKALLKEGVFHRVYFSRQGELDSRTTDQLPNDEDNCVEVFQIHGFTPESQIFNIGGIDFVFSAAQYANVYRNPGTVINGVWSVLTNPARVMLYVGCSFTDDAMNRILWEATSTFPGHAHYALMMRPENPEAFASEAERLSRLGLRVIWYDDHDAVPALIHSLS